MAMKNGKSMEEKSMEERTKFYNREDLSKKDVVDLIRIWESYAGESFTDYCSFSTESDKSFLEFLEREYPVLFEYHKDVAGDDWLEYCIQYVIFSCEKYLTRWIPEDKFPPYNEQLELALYPLAEFILKDDIAWGEFVDFFTSGDNTASGTPYIDLLTTSERIFEDGRL